MNISHIIFLLPLLVFIPIVGGRANLLLRNRRTLSVPMCLETMYLDGISSLQTSTCDPTNNDQLFFMDTLNRLVNPGNLNMCLEASGTGTSAFFSPCASKSSQFWEWNSAEQIITKSVVPWRCIDAGGSSTTPLAVTLKTCGTGNGQKWFRTFCDSELNSRRGGCNCTEDYGECRPNEIGNLLYRNRGSPNNNLCMEANDTSVISNLCNDNITQQITYDSIYRLQPESVIGKCFEAPLTLGDPVQVVDCAITSRQQWLIDGLDRFRSMANYSHCLDFSHSSTRATLILNTCSSASTQLFYRQTCPLGFFANSSFHCIPCSTTTVKTVVGNPSRLCKVACPPSTHFISVSRDKCAPRNTSITYGVTILAGGGRSTSLEGIGTSLSLMSPYGLTRDPLTGDIYFTEMDGHRIRKINETGYVTNVVGSGVAQAIDGSPLEARLSSPMGIIWMNNRLLFTEGSNRIRMVDENGHVSTLAGSAGGGFADGPSNVARFQSPTGLLSLNQTSILIADTDNNRIRILNMETQTVGTYVGTGLVTSQIRTANTHRLSISINAPVFMEYDPVRNNIFFTERDNHLLRRIQGDQVIYVSGIGKCNNGDGSRTSVQFCLPQGITYDAKRNEIVIVDGMLSRLRRIFSDFSSALMQVHDFNQTSSIITDGVGNILLADTSNGTIRKITICVSPATWNKAIEACQCPIGLTLNAVDNTCSQCPIGTVRTAVMAECGPCPLGTFSADNNTRCANCPAGTERRSEDLLTCTECPPFQFKSPLTADECSFCQLGWQINLNKGGCSRCGMGTYRSSVDMPACETCPLGTYRNSTSMIECAMCPVGTQSSSNFSSCITCTNSTYRSDLTIPICIPCPRFATCRPSGYLCSPSYENNPDLSICVRCPAGKMKSTAGNTPCTQCPAGQQPNANQTACVQCPSGTFKPLDTHLACRKCSDGGICNSVNITCKPGNTISKNDSYLCEYCEEGLFKPDMGNHACTPCNFGGYSSDDYRTCFECPAGFYLGDDNVCIRCGVGKQPVYNRTSCMDCPPGTFKPHDEHNQCVKCPDGASCTTISFTCDPGYEIDQWKSGCRRCEAGYAKKEASNTDKCVFCSVGYESNEDRSECVECRKGWYRSSTETQISCVECPDNHDVCRPDGFTCKEGYELNPDNSHCEQTEVTHSITDRDSNETMPISIKDSDGSDMNGNLDNLANLKLLYILAVPLSMIVIGVLYMIYRWQRKDVEEMNLYSEYVSKTSMIFEQTMTDTSSGSHSNLLKSNDLQAKYLRDISKNRTDINRSVTRSSSGGATVTSNNGDNNARHPSL